MRSVLTTLVVLLVATPAVAAPRAGTTTEGVKLSLDGRAASMRVPLKVPRGSDVELSCGAGRTVATRTVRSVRPRQRIAARLRGRLVAAEWCAFSVTEPTGVVDRIAGAATLLPRITPAPAPIGPGPGVRTAIADETRRSLENQDDDLIEGDAVFHLRGATLTVRLERPLDERSALIGLGCFRLADDVRAEQAALAYVAVGRGRRVITATLAGGNVAVADLCLVEDFGADIAHAPLGPPAP